MLRSVKEIKDFNLLTEDGEVGSCKDFLFDDRTWVVRYMVADTGKWLPGRKILISPASLGTPKREAKLLNVKLTKKQIEKSPWLDSDAPVSRQYEIAYYTYFGVPYYWDDPAASLPMVDTVPIAGDKAIEIEASPNSDEAHLRSAEEVTGYSIQAADGELGHVADFILDDETWNISYLVIDTDKWLPGKKFLVSFALLGAVDWLRDSVRVHMTREQLKKNPEYDSAASLNHQ
jgi:sporulation protein YlmC with PRC-barrel domain